jgi:hypothetical protein
MVRDRRRFTIMSTTVEIRQGTIVLGPTMVS